MVFSSTFGEKLVTARRSSDSSARLLGRFSSIAGDSFS